MSASALVFVHCFGGSARTWDEVIMRLDGGVSKVALDLPGFGDRANAAGPYTVDAYADFVEAQIRLHNLTRFIIVGHSMGGKVALALAARRPVGLTALVLLATSPATPEPIAELQRAKLIAGWGDHRIASDTLANITAHTLPAPLQKRAIDDLMRTGKAAWRAWLGAGSREDISPRMSSVGTRATVVSGAVDTVLPTSIQAQVVDMLPRAQLVTIPGAGHLLPLEDADAVAAVIEQASNAEQATSHSPRS